MTDDRRLLKKSPGLLGGKRRLVALLLGALILLGVFAVMMAPTPQQQERGTRRGGGVGEGPVPVLAVPAKLANVPVYLEGVGTARALNTVTVRPQVEGKLINVEFKEWQAWKENVFQEHDFDIIFAAWVFDDSADISSLFHSAEIGAWKNNFGGYSNPEVDGLIVVIVRWN